MARSGIESHAVGGIGSIAASSPWPSRPYGGLATQDYRVLRITWRQLEADSTTIARQLRAPPRA
jgi:hypothetical protein